MNWLTLALAIVHGIQVIYGDKASGTDKKQMAVDVLNSVSGSIIPGLSPQNQALGAAASQVAGVAIDQAVTIAKAAGTYQKATAIAAAAHQDVQIAAAVVGLAKAVQATGPST